MNWSVHLWVTHSHQLGHKINHFVSFFIANLYVIKNELIYNMNKYYFTNKIIIEEIARVIEYKMVWLFNNEFNAIIILKK